MAKRSKSAAAEAKKNSRRGTIKPKISNYEEKHRRIKDDRPEMEDIFKCVDCGHETEMKNLKGMRCPVCGGRTYNTED